MILPIYIEYTYFSSFEGYEDDILKSISHLIVQGFKIGREMDQLGGKSKKKFNSVEFMKFVFFPSLRSWYTPWILKWGRQESSGRRLFSSIGKTKMIAFYLLFRQKKNIKEL